jgi:glycosyltransferase involved in cell wall biosynthesis
MMKISVCMATYNGEKYVRIQLQSILKQIYEHDEVIIVDDGSVDNTIAVIESLQDKRIRLFVNEQNLGVTKAFEKALINSSGDIIFLSDQDDVWHDNKVTAIKNTFSETKADLIVHDAIILSHNGNVLLEGFFETLPPNSGFTANIVRNHFRGCCMAFRRNILSVALPFPAILPHHHDQWIGLWASFYNYKIEFMSDRLIDYMRHGNNLTGLETRDMIKIVKDRMNIVFSLLIHYVKYSRKI